MELRDDTRGAGDDTSGAPLRLVALTASLVSAYVARHYVATTDLAPLIRAAHATLCSLKNKSADAAAKPAVPVKKSVGDDFIICLEDGKRLKMLRRYLRTHFDMSPEQYRAKWALPLDYPMVAPVYARQRSAFAKRTGLGKRPRRGPNRPRR